MFHLETHTNDELSFYFQVVCESVKVDFGLGFTSKDGTKDIEYSELNT